MFDIRRNILSYATHRLYTLDGEKLYLLNARQLSDGKLSSTVFGQCIIQILPKTIFLFLSLSLRDVAVPSEISPCSLPRSTNIILPSCQRNWTFHRTWWTAPNTRAFWTQPQGRTSRPGELGLLLSPASKRKKTPRDRRLIFCSRARDSYKLGHPSNFDFRNSATLCSLLPNPLLSSTFSSSQDCFKNQPKIFLELSVSLEPINLP